MRRMNRSPSKKRNSLLHRPGRSGAPSASWGSFFIARGCHWKHIRFPPAFVAGWSGRGDGRAGNPIWPHWPSLHLVSHQPLAAAGSAEIAGMSYDQLLVFNGTGGCCWRPSFTLPVGAMVGLRVFGVTLPMFPRRPILLGGILAPLFWSGILYAEMGIINPTLQARIDWLRSCGLAVCFRPRGRVRRGAARKDFDAAAPAFCRAGRHQKRLGLLTRKVSDESKPYERACLISCHSACHACVLRGLSSARQTHRRGY